MSHKIKVMRANPDMDSQDIARLIKICREERRTVIDYFTVEEEREYLKNLHPKDSVFVARIDGVEFAGFASVSRRWPYSKRLQHCGEVGTYVMPAFRRRGVGSALWQIGVFPWCRIHGFKHLGFFIVADNRESIAFYESLGFRVCGYHRRVVNWEGDFLDAIEMELWLE